MRTTVSFYIAALADYAAGRGLIDPRDRTWAVNQLLAVLELDAYDEPEEAAAGLELEEILAGLLDDAEARGLIGGGVTARDLLDTKLMGALTPRPSWVIDRFSALAARDGRAATDWYYQFSQDTDYIRRYRVARDMKWITQTEYGALDITINLSKPEKDPKPSPPPSWPPRGDTPSASSAGRTRATPDGSITPPGAITAWSPSPSTAGRGFCSTPPTSTTTSTASSSTAGTCP